MPSQKMTPPQTPHSCRSRKASSRHLTRTGHPEQITCAAASSFGFSEKNSSWLPSWLHRPDSCISLSSACISSPNLSLRPTKKPPVSPTASAPDEGNVLTRDSWEAVLLWVRGHRLRHSGRGRDETPGISCDEWCSLDHKASKGLDQVRLAHRVRASQGIYRAGCAE